MPKHRDAPLTCQPSADRQQGAQRPLCPPKAKDAPCFRRIGMQPQFQPGSLGTLPPAQLQDKHLRVSFQRALGEQSKW